MIAVVVVAFCVGSIARFAGVAPPRVVVRAEQFVLFVALPAVIIDTMSTVAIDGTLLIPVIVAWTAILAGSSALYIVGRIRRWSNEVIGVALLLGVLGNTSFMGLGMVEGLLGSTHLSAAIAYDQLGTFLGLSIWGGFVVQRFGSQDLAWRESLVRIVRFPPFVALLISLVVRVVSLPEVGHDVLGLLGRTVAPVAMFAVGARIHLRPRRHVVAPAIWTLSIKMLVVPAVVVLVVVAAGWNGDVMWSTSVVQAAAPPMVTAGLIATRSGFDEELSAFVVGVGTVLGFVSVPVFSLFVG